MCHKPAGASLEDTLTCHLAFIAVYAAALCGFTDGGHHRHLLDSRGTGPVQIIPVRARREGLVVPLLPMALALLSRSNNATWSVQNNSGAKTLMLFLGAACVHVKVTTHSQWPYPMDWS
jgi:hypothetical protein